MTQTVLHESLDGVIRTRLLVRGVVQGVGFRPHLYRLACERGLRGWIQNAPAGVIAELQGPKQEIERLVRELRHAPPDRARVDAIDISDLPLAASENLEIRPSHVNGRIETRAAPDIATCQHCLAEMYDPSNRRYRYPFINCTQCGPRYSIIESLPYDRARTSMRHFPMCVRCQAEYENPMDRRFHAEPNACADCGPRLTLWDAAGQAIHEADAALARAANAIREGMILAVKGIGGFHLLADAWNDAAVARLRSAKRRPDKPFAVMFESLAELTKSCTVSLLEEDLLTGWQRPVVLLKKPRGMLAPAVTRDSPWLGAMLPYTPLHHLLLRDLGFPVVATSGNRSDEPIAIDNREALAHLRGIADFFLIHDRPVVRPLDDSVMREVCGRELVLRNARGYAPTMVAHRGISPGIVAVGGHQKATIALSTRSGVLLSQHIGDLDTVGARGLHADVASDMTALHTAARRLIVSDPHPDYASHVGAVASEEPAFKVQHHLAHVVSCMAEHQIPPPVLGVAWDGTGYGTDGTIWGGEFLLVDRHGWRRIACLRPFPLPGGEAAIREPRRSALGLLFAAFGEDAFGMTEPPPMGAFTEHERRTLRAMLRRRLNTPSTSSVGRLFDGFAALAGMHQRTTYEGQAAAALEGLARADTRPCYDFPVIAAVAGDPPMTIDWVPALEQLLKDLRSDVSREEIATALHNGLASAVADVARRAGRERVILSGGCFQNARLTEATVAALREIGCQPAWHQRVPPNDGGLALGQAVWVGWMETAGAAACASRSPA